VILESYKNVVLLNGHLPLLLFQKRIEVADGYQIFVNLIKALVMDFGSRFKTLNRLLQLMPHPEDQNGLSKEDMRIIIIRSMPDEWQQEFELNHAKTSDQSIRSVLAYFESQQSFKDRNKHLPKNSFQTITQNRLRIAEGNRVMRQENERVSRQFYNDNFTPSGRGRARAIVNAAGRAWDRQATVLHQALQASHTYHDYRDPCPVPGTS
jgi:hypothetical protein